MQWERKNLRMQGIIENRKTFWDVTLNHDNMACLQSHHCFFSPLHYEFGLPNVVTNNIKSHVWKRKRSTVRSP